METSSAVVYSCQTERKERVLAINEVVNIKPTELVGIYSASLVFMNLLRPVHRLCFEAIVVMHVYILMLDFHFQF